jgi:hypothetical protein
MLNQNFHFDSKTAKIAGRFPISYRVDGKPDIWHGGWNGRSTKSGAVIYHWLTPEIGHPGSRRRNDVGLCCGLSQEALGDSLRLFKFAVLLFAR